MTISTLSTITGRIESAYEESPIAVFATVMGGKQVLDAVFESAFATKERVKSNDTSYIGSYWGEFGAEKARNDIKALPKIR